jgi:hypothetical protein
MDIPPLPAPLPIPYAMNSIKYIGIDVHQATSVFAVMNQHGKITGEAVLEIKPATIIDFLKGQRGTFWSTFEEGTYANLRYDVIQPHVAKRVACDPRKNKLDGNKSDKIDAKRLADLLRMNALKAVYHGQNGTRTLKELARNYVSLQQDSTRVIYQPKAMFRSRGIDCHGTSVYQPENRKEWLEKLDGNGLRHRAERLLKQLELLEELCLEAQHDLIREARKHKSFKILGEIPGLGPIRVALILAFVMTPHRFHNKRQFWTHTGFSVVRRGSAEYEITQGEMKRTKKKPLIRSTRKHFANVLRHHPNSRPSPHYQTKQ